VSPPRRWTPGWRTLPLGAQLAAIVLVPLLAWTLFARQLIQREDRAAERSAREQHRLRDAVVLSARLLNAMLNMETGQRGFVATGDTALLQPYERGQREFYARVDSLARLADTADAELVGLVRFLEWQLVEWDQQSGTPAVLMRRSFPGPNPDVSRALLPELRRGKRSMDSARVIQARIRERIERRERDLRDAEQERLALSRRRGGALWAALLALLAVVTWSSAALITRTVRRIGRTTRALADGEYGAAAELSAVEMQVGGHEMAALAADFGRLGVALQEREQLAQSEILQLRELEQLKTDFVSTVSHELRTPLTSIRGALGLILGGAAGAISDQARPLLRIAQQNTERLIRLINDILDIEKIEAGQVRLRTERCDLGAILQNTLAGVSAVALESGVRLELDTRAPGAAVEGDPDRLVQLFTNLVSNAIKFSPRGTAVQVRLDEHDGRARVSVRDQGPGIPPEFQDRIFGRFQQAEHADSRHGGGTGLGLAIAHAIAEMHRGTIGFETAPGAGTTFHVELPRQAEPLPRPSATFPLVDGPGSPAPSAPGADGGRPRILIVDDDADMRSVLTSLCAPLGDCSSTSSPIDAWDLVRRTRYDALVIDPDYPAGVGLAFLRRLRALDAYAATPVLVFSAREYAASELASLTLIPTHAYVKSRDSEQELVLRLRAVLAARGES